MIPAYFRLAVSALAVSILSMGTAASGQANQPKAEDTTQDNARRQSTFLDLEAGLGYSTNAFLGLNAESSIYGRLSASGAHSWFSETGMIGIRGFVENTSYFRGGYGSKQIFSLGASTTQQLSPTVSVYGDLGFSGDFGGQLANRFLFSPTGPVVPDPMNPIPEPNVNPDPFGITGRQYRINGNAGVSIRSSARSLISLSGGVDHSFSNGSNEGADFTTYHGTGSYARDLSERTRAGVSLTAAHQDFRSGGTSTTINPALFASAQLSEALSAEGSIGVMRIHQSFEGGSDTSTAMSFSGSLCSRSTVSSICGHVARDAQTGLSSGVIGGLGQAAITTTADISYWRRLGPNDTIRASVSASRYSAAASIEGADPRTTYVSGLLGYDHNINARLFGGINGGVRRLFQSGPDPDTDFNVTVYLRYRLGDLQ